MDRGRMRHPALRLRSDLDVAALTADTLVWHGSRLVATLSSPKLAR